ncbi:MAG TPA: hypothetical protein VKX49_31485 [Bryobacteraceae bacterium]|nr:hypothetical protein [Bryobacteraceae bacterium]
MAYEVFKRTSVRVESPAVSIAPDGRITFNAAATRALAEAGIRNVILLWDKKEGRIAVKATARSDKNSYAVSIVRDRHSGTLRARSFLRHIGWTATRRETLPAIWNDKEKMIEIALPTAHLALKNHGSGLHRMKVISEPTAIPTAR